MDASGRAWRPSRAEILWVDGSGSVGRAFAWMTDPLRVLYLDNHLLVVDKPAGLLTQSDSTGDEDLLTLAKAYIKRRFDKPGAVFAGLVHRLDRPASGTIVIARTSKAASRLSEQFRARTVGKRYLALVEGRLDGEGRREDWLLKERDRNGTRVRRVKPTKPGAKKAVLDWRALSVESRRSLIEVDLGTGRAHQIRVQLAALGHPIQGDLKYGASKPFGGGRAIALHARELTLDHPTQKERISFAADLPTTWPHEIRSRF